MLHTGGVLHVSELSDDPSAHVVAGFRLEQVQGVQQPVHDPRAASWQP